ncbi:MAG: hypothetical protein KDB03_28405, partial [Planctomycetales bacterium]|nr:hypothetical protein [Planctomycetales bacterium]
GENLDGENLDGENLDGENLDGENPDGENPEREENRSDSSGPMMEGSSCESAMPSFSVQSNPQGHRSNTPTRASHVRLPRSQQNDYSRLENDLDRDWLAKFFQMDAMVHSFTGGWVGLIGLVVLLAFLTLPVVVLLHAPRRRPAKLQASEIRVDSLSEASDFDTDKALVDTREVAFQKDSSRTTKVREMSVTLNALRENETTTERNIRSENTSGNEPIVARVSADIQGLGVGDAPRIGDSSEELTKANHSFQASSETSSVVPIALPVERATREIAAAAIRIALDEIKNCDYVNACNTLENCADQLSVDRLGADWRILVVLACCQILTEDEIQLEQAISNLLAVPPAEYRNKHWKYVYTLWLLKSNQRQRDAWREKLGGISDAENRFILDWYGVRSGKVDDDIALAIEESVIGHNDPCASFFGAIAKVLTTRRREGLTDLIQLQSDLSTQPDAIRLLPEFYWIEKTVRPAILSMVESISGKIGINSLNGG